MSDAPRPFLTLKLATSLDGRIATATGESRWITGEAARTVVHELRAQHDAVLVGIETALADNPELTVRLRDYDGPQPARVVVDSRGRLPVSALMVQTARIIPTYVLTTQPLSAELKAAGVKELRVGATPRGRVDLNLGLTALTEAGLERVFVEGGGQIASALIRLGVIDRLEWFRAPILLGAEGRPGIGDLGISALGEALSFSRLAVQAVGADLWESYEAD